MSTVKKGLLGAGLFVLLVLGALGVLAFPGPHALGGAPMVAYANCDNNPPNPGLDCGTNPTPTPTVTPTPPGH